MTPPSDSLHRRAHDGDSLNWNKVAKVSIGIIGGILSIVISIAARAAEKQATAFEQLKEAVYSGQRDNAVLSNRVLNLEDDHKDTKERVKIIESRLNKDSK